MNNLSWNAPLTAFKGIGATSEKKFFQLGIETLADLLLHLPHRYEDKTRLFPIQDLIPGQFALIEGCVTKVNVIRARRKQLIIHIAQGPSTLKVIFYHFYSSQVNAYSKGMKVRCFGQVNRVGWGHVMVHPEIIRLSAKPLPLDEHLCAVYPTVKGISQTLWRNTFAKAFAIEAKHPFPDGLPVKLREEKKWPTFFEALNFIHQPPPSVTLTQLESVSYPAMERLICEELLAHQLSWNRYRKEMIKQSTQAFKVDKIKIEDFISCLPFKLTQAQQKVLSEIKKDVTHTSPMLRLVQGDVGSGKTVVAAVAALMALLSGKKVALMAPTGLLVHQHVKNFKRWFEAFNIPVCELTRLTSAKERKALQIKLNDEAPLIIIGTHALIQPEITISELGLIIIDEQHRFGVAQRLKLSDKNPHYPPHQLIMSATPIPRTLVMTYYADMAISIIDELPNGRQPIKTVALSADKREEILKRIESICKQGQQVYWICPLIEESEQLAIQSALETQLLLSAKLPNLSIGLVHGKMPAVEKAEMMSAFNEGKIQLLVSTTVVEVGVDVPNATLMVIENAERLGLAQAHQLRGRVGRGHAQSFCVLLFEGPLSEMARERMTVLRESCDGFVIAEKDLELRGPGEILGTRQAGGQQFKIADLSRDHHYLKEMALLAPQFLNEFPNESELLIARWCQKKIPYVKV